MASPTIVINASEDSPANSSAQPEKESESQERREALELGAVLEAHRQTIAQQATISQRLDSLEASQAGWGGRFDQIDQRLDLLTAVEAAELEEEIEEGEAEPVLPEETPPAEPEPEPVKSRSVWHRMLYG